MVAPAPLVGPELLLRAGKRGDLAGALVLGTIVVTVVLLTARAIAPVEATTAGLEAFAVGAFVANGVPPLRDLVLMPLRIVGWVAFALVFVAALIESPAFDATAVVAAVLVLLVGIAAAAAAAAITGRDRIASIGGAGLRDPAIACAVAYLGAGADAVPVTLVYGVFCLGLAAFTLRRG